MRQPSATRRRTASETEQPVRKPEYEITDGERRTSFAETLYVRHHPETNGTLQVTVSTLAATTDQPYQPDLNLEITWHADRTGCAPDTGTMSIPIPGSIDGLEAFTKLLERVVVRSRKLGHLTPLTRD